MGASGGLPIYDVVVEHDAVFVVDDLGLVAELDGLAEPTLADRTGVGIVERDEARRPVGDVARQTLAGLAGDAGTRSAVTSRSWATNSSLGGAASPSWRSIRRALTRHSLAPRRQPQRRCGPCGR